MLVGLFMQSCLCRFSFTHLNNAFEIKVTVCPLFSFRPMVAGDLKKFLPLFLLFGRLLFFFFIYYIIKFFVKFWRDRTVFFMCKNAPHYND